jgi:hypothetical protein
LFWSQDSGIQVFLWRISFAMLELVPWESFSFNVTKLDSVALLSKQATEKNLFYISNFAWPVGTFQRSVNPDFTLEDGLTICAAMTCVCNANLIVYALVSGALRRR